jgi:DNA-binding LacI/PurR family transcriptional regulator
MRPGNVSRPRSEPLLRNGLPRPGPQDPAAIRHRAPRPHGPDALASQVMQGVEEEAQERGYAVMLGPTGAKYAYIASYLLTLRTYRAAGVVLISAVVTPATRQLLKPNVPIISVAISDRSGSPSVAIDDEQAAYDATRHLPRLGHRRIGLLTGDPVSIHDAQTRLPRYARG